MGPSIETLAGTGSDGQYFLVPSPFPEDEYFIADVGKWLRDAGLGISIDPQKTPDGRFPVQLLEGDGDVVRKANAVLVQEGVRARIRSS